MLYLMLSNTAVLWICIIIAVILVAAALGYVYYRVKIKPEYCGDNNEEDDLHSKGEKEECGEGNNSVKEPEKSVNSAPETNSEENAPAPEQTAPKTVKEQEKKEEKEITPDGIVTPAAPAVTAADDGTEILYQNENGKIDIIAAEGGFKFRLFSSDGVAGESDIYQTKLGLLKGLKSLVNYKDTAICEAPFGDDKAASARFEIFRDEDGKYGYYLKTKIKTKFSGKGFDTKILCIKAIESVKKIGVNFEI